MGPYRMATQPPPQQPSLINTEFRDISALLEGAPPPSLPKYGRQGLDGRTESAGSMKRSGSTNSNTGNTGRLETTHLPSVTNLNNVPSRLLLMSQAVSTVRVGKYSTFVKRPFVWAVEVQVKIYWLV